MSVTSTPRCSILRYQLTATHWKAADVTEHSEPLDADEKSRLDKQRYEPLLCCVVSCMASNYNYKAYVVRCRV